MNRGSHDWLTIRWFNTLKQRYYMSSLQQDMFGDWVLIKYWGSSNNRVGRIKKECCESYHEGCNKLVLLNKRRIQRGYHKD